MRRVAEPVWLGVEGKHNGATLPMAQRRHDWDGIELMDAVGIYWAAITEERESSGWNGLRQTEHKSMELGDHFVRTVCLPRRWEESQDILHAAARIRSIRNVHSSSKISSFDG